jgi:hypothetical protein
MRRLRPHWTPQNANVLEITAVPRSKMLLLHGYDKNDRTILQRQLKNTYWQRDKQRDTTAILNKLVKSASDLNVFLLKYTAISANLINKGALSPLKMDICCMGFQLNCATRSSSSVRRSPGASVHTIPIPITTN